MFKKYTLLLVLILLRSASLLAQHPYPNLDFSRKNFSNWRLYQGPQQGTQGDRTIAYQEISTDAATVPGNPFQFIYPPTNPAARPEDPNTCYNIRRVPLGKAYSVRVGPLSPGGYGSPQGYKAAYTLAVSADRPTLVYRFAFVQQFDHGSSAGNDPMGFQGGPTGAGNNAAMWLQTLDANGNKVAAACGNYRLYPGAASGVEWFDWNHCGEISNTPWMTDVIDLTPFIGQDITIEFNTMDCYTGHHMSYAYVSPESFAHDTISWYCPGGDALVRGPYGFKTYSWEEVDANDNPVANGLKLTKQNALKIGTDLEGANDLVVQNPVPMKRYACTFTSYSGCSGRVIYEIRPDSIKSGFDWVASTGGCRKAVFTDKSITALPERTAVSAWKWSFSDPGSGTLNNSVLQNPSHIFSLPGDFDVKLVATSSFGCKDSTIHKVTIADDPVTVATDFTFLTNTCAIEFKDASAANGGESIVAWEWEFGDDSTSKEQNPRHIYQAAGDYVVTLTATSSIGCASTIQKTITVASEMLEYVKADFSQSADGCMSFAFKDASVATPGTIISWAWNFSDINSGNKNTSDLQNPSHLFGSAGIYPVTLKVVASDGCYRIVQNTVMISSAESIFDAHDGCEGKAVPFEAQKQDDVTKYTWSFNDGTAEAEGLTVSHMFPVTGEPKIYRVKLSVASTNGCTYDSEKDVTIRLKPKAGFSFSQNELIRYRPVVFKDISDGGTKWEWDFGDGNIVKNSDPATRDMTHTYDGDPEKYEISQIVSNSAGCTDTLFKTVYLNQGIVTANAFSPNGDGNNDSFRLIYRGVDKLHDFRIYNRWGELVFDAGGNIDAVWDGSLNGKQQPIGAYVYYVKATTFEGEEISMSGGVNLVR